MSIKWASITEDTIIPVAAGTAAAQAGRGLLTGHPIATGHTAIPLVPTTIEAADVGRRACHRAAAFATIFLTAAERAVIAKVSPFTRHPTRIN